MPVVSIVCGGLLIAVGVWGYLPSHSGTALIPAGIGGALVVLGLLALKESLLKHTMHAAAAIGLLSFLVTGVMGLPKLARMLAGEQLDRPRAVISQSLTAGICAVFVALCVNSFIQARRRRAARARAEGGAGGP
jgi:hypothetical protein